MQRRQLVVESANDGNVAAFGALVGVPDATPRTSAFYQGAVHLWSPAAPFVSDSDTCLSIARVFPRDREVTWMERHFKHTQVFLPLNGAPFVVVLAPPNDRNLPDLDQARALRFDGNAGLQMHVGTWHEFPFAVGDAVDMVVVLRNETNRNLEVMQDGEAVGGDLEKRNVRARLGVTLAFATT